MKAPIFITINKNIQSQLQKLRFEQQKRSFNPISKTKKKVGLVINKIFL